LRRDNAHLQPLDFSTLDGGSPAEKTATGLRPGHQLRMAARFTVLGSVSSSDDAAVLEACAPPRERNYHNIKNLRVGDVAGLTCVAALSARGRHAIARAAVDRQAHRVDDAAAGFSLRADGAETGEPCAAPRVGWAPWPMRLGEDCRANRGLPPDG